MQVRGNLHMVAEVVAESVDYGVAACQRQHAVLDRLHSKYLPPKPALLALARSGSGRPSHFRCAGPLSARLRRCMDALQFHVGHTRWPAACAGLRILPSFCSDAEWAYWKPLLCGHHANA